MLLMQKELSLIGNSRLIFRGQPERENQPAHPAACRAEPERHRLPDQVGEPEPHALLLEATGQALRRVVVEN